MTIVRESFNSQANSTATTTPTVNAPSGVVSGNVLVCAIGFNGTPGTITPPADWVQVAFEAGASNPRLGMWYKVAGGSEPASYQWSHTTSVASGMVIARYSGVNTSTPSDTAGVPSFSASTTSNFNATGITTVTDGAMVIGACSVNSSSTVITENSAIMTVIAEVAGKRCELDDGIQATAGATGVQNYTFSAARACAAIIWALRPAIGGAYTLPAAVGSFGLTGQATALRTARVLSTTTTAYGLTGVNTVLRAGRKFAAAAGSFSLTGQGGNLRTARKLAATVGAYTLTGQNALLKAARKLVADVSAFTLTGYAATLTASIVQTIHHYTMTALTGAFDVLGQAASLKAARNIIAGSGSYTLSESAAGLQAARRLSAQAGGYVVTGGGAAIRTARRLVVSVGQFVMTGIDALVLFVPRFTSGGTLYLPPRSPLQLQTQSALTLPEKLTQLFHSKTDSDNTRLEGD